MIADRSLYARKALQFIPRLLGNMDRDPHSPTYGSMDRLYWHDKVSDFSDADHHLGVLALALVYRYDFPENPYRGNAQVRDWAIAGMDFWTRIQHADGSFDEHYPNEHGWAGPTAFSTYGCAEAFKLLEADIASPQADRIRNALRKAAYLLVRGQHEDDHLANHHAIACLAVWKVYEVLKEADLEAGFNRLWKGFLGYYDAEEGWSREYDGADPGYLSATVSFLAKIYATRPDSEMLKVLTKSVEFCSYFAYPDGSYGGTVGSRNTLHFYPHGFELLGSRVPFAASLAEQMLTSLGQGKLVPPDIMPDRYLAYRLPEYLMAYLDYAKRPEPLERLPAQSTPFRQYFPNARILVVNTAARYTVVNLAKGGVLKSFSKVNGAGTNDAGIVARLSDGTLASSQWIDTSYQVKHEAGSWEVSGQMHTVPVSRRFTPRTFLLFRATLYLFGWSPTFAHWIKRNIRRSLILKAKPVALLFKRRAELTGEQWSVTDEIQNKTGLKVVSLSIGGDFQTRHVPQSTYFQIPQLEDKRSTISPQQLDTLNITGTLQVQHSPS